MGVYEKARLETRKKIMDSFWKLYKKRPISHITVREVAEASGVHRSTIYLHFQDIYQILEEIENSLLRKIKQIDVSSADSVEGLNRIGQFLFQEYRKDRDYLRVLVKEQRDYKFSSKYRKCLQDLMINVAQESSPSDNAFNKRLMEITAAIIIESFLQCADDDLFSFEDTQKVLAGFMRNGYQKTLSIDFSVAGLRNPI